jgi:hypothetical protein
MHLWEWVLVAVGVVALVVLVVAAVYWRRELRTRRLRGRFGPEYSRAISNANGRREGEAQLEERVRRADDLDLHSIADDSLGRYQAEWVAIQGRFVDDPGGAVRDAERLVASVLTERGYPNGEFGQLADDISVEYPEVAADYREAHSVYDRQRSGEATTEELRHAMKDYRRIVFELLGARSDRTSDRAAAAS